MKPQLILLLFFCFFSAVYPQVIAQKPPSEAILVVVMTKAAEPTYRIGEKMVKGAALPDALVAIKRAQGTNAKVSVIFDGKVRFETMFFVVGTIGKLGFERVECYVMDDYQRTMVEVNLGKGNISVGEILRSKP